MAKLLPPWAHSAAIVVLGLLCYAHVLNAPFVYDDIGNIPENPYMRVVGLDWQGYARAAIESRSPRPVANLSFAINHGFCGYDTGCFRAVNIAVHLANALLLRAIAVLLFLRIRPGDTLAAERFATFSALFFVAHPLQIQGVTYIVQRMTSLATLFYLLALWLWLRSRLLPSSAGNSERRSLWLGAAVAGVLAFGSKQIAITLPLAIALVEWIFFRDASWGWLRKRMALAAGLLGVVALLGIAYLASLGFPGYELRDFTMGQRLLTQLRVVPFYLSLVLLPLPSRLNLIHRFETSTSLVDPISTLFGGLFLVALALVAAAIVRRERFLGFAIFWLFLQLALESSFLPLEMAYEHRMVLPMVGVALAFGEAMHRLCRARGAWLALVGFALIAALASATHLRNRAWNDAVTLWFDVAAKSPLEKRAHTNLVFALKEAERLPEAEAHMRALLERYPDFAVAWHDYGLVAGWEGRIEDAKARYAEALRLDPEKPLFSIKLGLAMFKLGDPEGAIRVLDALARAHPEDAPTHFALASVLRAEGRTKEAEAAYRSALRADPDHQASLGRLASILEGRRDYAQALEVLRHALRLDPYDEALKGRVQRAERLLALSRADERSGG